MTDSLRIDRATDATSAALPATDSIKLPDLHDRAEKRLNKEIRLGDFRAALLRLVDSGEAFYKGDDEIIRARAARN
jgi:hypothetical protein